MPQVVFKDLQSHTGVYAYLGCFVGSARAKAVWLYVGSYQKSSRSVHEMNDKEKKNKKPNQFFKHKNISQKRNSESLMKKPSPCLTALAQIKPGI